MEEVCDRAMDGHEALALPLPPSTHASFSLSSSQMRILRPVIQAFMRAMVDTAHDFSSGCIVGFELVGDYDTWRGALALKYFRVSRRAAVLPRRLWTDASRK